MKQLFFLLFFVFFSSFLYAQVGINTITPRPNAVLDVNSAFAGGGYGGFLPPRVTLAQRNSIVTSVADDGLMVYVILPSGQRCLQLFNGNSLAWEDIKCFGGTSGVTQLRIMNNYATGLTQYSFTTGDIIYLNTSGGTLSDSNTNNICAGAEKRTQLPSVILHLTSSSTSGITIHGTSAGPSARTLSNVETAATLNGTYTPIAYSTSSTISGGVDNCGVITVTGIAIPANTFIRFTFNGGSVNLSGFDIVYP